MTVSFQKGVQQEGRGTEAFKSWNATLSGQVWLYLGPVKSYGFLYEFLREVVGIS